MVNPTPQPRARGSRPARPIDPRRAAQALAGGLLVSVIWVSAAGTGQAQAPTPALEYSVKANFLYKFAPFVEWPAQAFASATSPFNVCVAGQDPFDGALAQATRGQTVRGHPIVVRRVPDAPGQTDCHILYVGRSGTTKSSDVLRALNGAPVLTVTDERQGVDGGVIHFVVRDGKVRFGINPASAQARGLTISSKLLGLAVPVRPVGG